MFITKQLFAVFIEFSGTLMTIAFFFFFSLSYIVIHFLFASYCSKQHCKSNCFADHQRNYVYAAKLQFLVSCWRAHTAIVEAAFFVLYFYAVFTLDPTLAITWKKN